MKHTKTTKPQLVYVETNTKHTYELICLFRTREYKAADLYGCLVWVWSKTKEF